MLMMQSHYRTALEFELSKYYLHLRCDHSFMNAKQQKDEEYDAVYGEEGVI